MSRDERVKCLLSRSMVTVDEKLALSQESGGSEVTKK